MLDTSFAYGHFWGHAGADFGSVAPVHQYNPKLDIAITLASTAVQGMNCVTLRESNSHSSDPSRPAHHRPTRIGRLTVRLSLAAGVDQCSAVQVLTSALVSTGASALVTLLGRLAFKRAGKRGEGRAALTW